MWSPSSLIFIVLLGVWAAYFLQYWIRRRDHLATARSVEQFSEAMRVLERRDTTPRTDLSEPTPRSWNLHPATATTRPQVLVKRAVASEPVVPVATARIEAEPATRSDRPRVERPAGTGGSAAATSRTAAAAPAAPAPGASDTGTAPAARLPAPSRVRPSRRVRALLMLVALAELVGISVLVALGSLALWALAPAAVAVVASFAYVRAGVRAEQRLRAARRRAARARRATPAAGARLGTARVPAPTRSTAVAAGERPRRGVAPDPPDTTTASPAQTRLAETPLAETPLAETSADAAVETSAVAEPVAPAAAAETPAVAEPVVDEPEHIEYVHLVDEDDIPLTWEPVPVPRPTYTMKARAERPEVPPAEVTPDPAPVALPDQDGVPERRVAGA